MDSAKPTLEIALAIVRRANLWLVARRRPEAHLGGLWEFPGGKCNPGESPVVAAAREVLEECGIHVRGERVLLRLPVDYGDRICNLHAVLCAWVSGEPQALGNDACQWVSDEELRRLDMPEVNAKIVAALRSLSRVDR